MTADPPGAAMVGRHKNVLQVMIAFETEADAVLVLTRIMDELVARKQTSIIIHGSSDDILMGKPS